MKETPREPPLQPPLEPSREPPRLDAAATAALLPYERLLPAIERAAREHADGTIRCPARSVVALDDDARLLSMPAAAPDLAIHKLITVVPGNASRGLAVVQGTLTLVDPCDGRALLVLDGPTVTGRRTAAVSLCAIRRLAPPDAGDVLVIGTGEQARHHVEALVAIGGPWRVRVRGRTRAASESFVVRMRSMLSGLAIATDDAPDDDADVVIACTTSRTPVYSRAARAGTLVIAVGSFRPDAAEVAAATVRASAIAVDDLAGARDEAGDLILAGIDWDDVTSLAALFDDRARGDPPPWLFKSVGCAAWDVAAARVAREVHERTA